MSVSHVLVPLAVAGLAAPPDVDAHSLTEARFWATSAALLGLAGAITGGVALARAARRTGGGSRAAVVALISGVVAAAGGALNLAVADGGPGTGNGVVGGALALVSGLAAMVLGWRTLARSRDAGARTTSVDRP